MINANEVAHALGKADVDLPTCRDCGQTVMLFRQNKVSEKTGKQYYVQLNMDFSQHYKTCKKDKKGGEDGSIPF